MPFLKDRKQLPRSRKLENSAKKSGLRHKVFNTVGDTYLGEWQNDCKTGKGVIVTRHRETYEGDMSNGYRHGFGVLAYELPNKTFTLEYRGFWKNGRLNGLGLRRYKDGSTYIGKWKNGKRHGYGLMWYSNGDFYAGNFVGDLKQGLGMLVHPNSNRYEGSWFGDLKHGKGKYWHLKTGQLQKGVWMQNICVFCTFNDVKYRQSAVLPTPVPIHKLELMGVEELCTEREYKALSDYVHSCISIKDSNSGEEMTSKYSDCRKIYF